MVISGMGKENKTKMKRPLKLRGQTLKLLKLWGQTLKDLGAGCNLLLRGV